MRVGDLVVGWEDIKDMIIGEVNDEVILDLSSVEFYDWVDKSQLYSNAAYNRNAVVVQHFPAEVHDVQRQLGYTPRVRIARLRQSAHRHVLVTYSFYLQ